MKWPLLSIALSTAALAGVAGLAVLRNPGPPPPGAEVEPVRAVPETTEEGPMLGRREQAHSEDRDLDAVLHRLASLEQTVTQLEAELRETREVLDPVKDLLALLAREKPRLMGARMRAHQTAAIATLRNVVSAQAQVQASGRIDTDQDGTGEYGGFLEMSGGRAGRMARPLVPPVLSRAFRTLNDEGEVLRSGYLFRIYLPDSHGRAIGEPTDGFAAGGGIDADMAETTWCVYAWPAEAGDRNRPTFFANQAGDVLQTIDDRYVGPGRGPDPSAAFRGSAITGETSIGGQGSDGNTWKRAG